MTIEELFTILLKDKPSKYIMKEEGKVFNLIPGLKECKNFNKNKKWHGPNIYEHTLNVVDSVPNKLELRLSALFHDISKPHSYIEDGKRIIDFKNTCLVSADVFKGFANNNNIDSKIKDSVIKLIMFQNIDVNKLNSKELKYITNVLSKEEIMMLYELKEAELKAQSIDYIKRIKEEELKSKTMNYTNIIKENYQKQKTKMLKRYEG